MIALTVMLWIGIASAIVLVFALNSTNTKLQLAKDEQQVIKWLLFYFVSMKNAMQDYIAEKEDITYFETRQRVSPAFNRMLSLPHLLPSAPVDRMPVELREAAMRYNADMQPVYNLGAAVEDSNVSWEQLRLSTAETAVNTMPAFITAQVEKVAETAGVDEYATAEVLKEIAFLVGREFANRLGQEHAELILPSRY